MHLVSSLYRLHSCGNHVATAQHGVGGLTAQGLPSNADELQQVLSVGK